MTSCAEINHPGDLKHNDPRAFDRIRFSQRTLSRRRQCRDPHDFPAAAAGRLGEPVLAGQRVLR